MNETLKGIAHIGAELAAAKADLQCEMERHRKTWRQLEQVTWLLREINDSIQGGGRVVTFMDDDIAAITAALSQQAEPVCQDCLGYQEAEQNPSVLCDECGWKQSEPVEPAPAQDEREAVVVVGYAYNLESGAYSQYPGADWSALMTVTQHERIVAALTRPAHTEQQPVCWASSTALAKLQNGRNNSPCVLTDGPAEFNDTPLYAAPIAQTAPQGKFRIGDLVKKISGSEWEGHICGTYSTELTPEGYAVESAAHRGSVQIYPAKALELVPMAAKEA